MDEATKEWMGTDTSVLSPLGSLLNRMSILQSAKETADPLGKVQIDHETHELEKKILELIGSRGKENE